MRRLRALGTCIGSHKASQTLFPYTELWGGNFSHKITFVRSHVVFSSQMKSLRQNFCIGLFICVANILLWHFKMKKIWNGHTADHTDSLFSRFLALETCTGRPRTYRIANDSIVGSVFFRRRSNLILTSPVRPLQGNLRPRVWCMYIKASVWDFPVVAERTRLIANDQPREDARLRGGNLIELCAIVPGAAKISNRCNIQ